MHLAGSGAVAYYFAAQIRDIKTRPNVLAGFQLAESGSVPFLTKLGDTPKGLPRASRSF
jgi:hypothetical protein